MACASRKGVRKEETSGRRKWHSLSSKRKEPLVNAYPGGKPQKKDLGQKEGRDPTIILESRGVRK